MIRGPPEITKQNGELGHSSSLSAQKSQLCTAASGFWAFLAIRLLKFAGCVPS